jgi:ankyrin repeat protein
MKKMILQITLMLSFITPAFSQDIYQAARANDTVFITYYIKEGRALNEANERGFTPLILAVYNGNMEVVKLFIHSKANPDAQDKSGNTALMGAIFKGYDEIALYLIENSDINVRNFNNATALTFAATFGRASIVEALLKAGADKTIKDKFGKDALAHAQMQENKIIIDLLK